jgi:hypothetical protein
MGWGGGGGETPQPPKVPPMIPNLSMLDFGMGRREGHTFKQKTIYKPSYVGSGEAPGFEKVMIGKAPKILTGGEIRGVVGKKKKKHKQKWYERM